MELYQRIIQHLNEQLNEADRSVEFWKQRDFPAIAVNRDWCINNALRIKATFIYDTIIRSCTPDHAHSMHWRIMQVCERLDAAEMHYPYPRYLSRETRALFRNLKKAQKELASIGEQRMFVPAAAEIVMTVQRFALDHYPLFRKEEAEIFSTLVSIIFPDSPDGFRFPRMLQERMVALLHSHLLFTHALFTISPL